MKCLQTGMKREAVQEERSRGKGGGGGNNDTGNNNAAKKELNNVVDTEPESTCTNSDMPLDRILEAQVKSEKAGEDPSKHRQFRQVKLVKLSEYFIFENFWREI